jgi:hypothetical protein
MASTLNVMGPVGGDDVLPSPRHDRAPAVPNHLTADFHGSRAEALKSTDARRCSSQGRFSETTVLLVDDRNERSARWRFRLFASKDVALRLW